MKKEDLLKIKKTNTRTANSFDRERLYKWIKAAHRVDRTSCSWPGSVPESSWLIRELEENGFEVKEHDVFGRVISWD